MLGAGRLRTARPPAFGGVFLPRFFLRYRRKNRAPGGRQPYRMEEIRIRKTTNNTRLQASTERRKRKRSGKRQAYQAG